MVFIFFPPRVELFVSTVAMANEAGYHAQLRLFEPLSFPLLPAAFPIQKTVISRFQYIFW